jgi:hypothetical protein
MRRLAGTSTGAVSGNIAGKGGTGGSVDPHLLALRCLFTSASIRGTDILGWSSSRCCAARVTVISLVTGQSASILRNVLIAERVKFINGVARTTEDQFRASLLHSSANLNSGSRGSGAASSVSNANNANSTYREFVDRSKDRRITRSHRSTVGDGAGGTMKTRIGGGDAIK